MKTGKVARLFNIDPKTTTNWTDEFGEFFSDAARGEGRIQRDYSAEDLIVLNTIKSERARRIEVEEIRAKLAAGHRDTALPPEAMSIEGERAMVVYAQLKMIETQLEAERRDNERLRKELDAERRKNEALNREVGKWQALAELYDQQIHDTHDDE